MKFIPYSKFEVKTKLTPQQIKYRLNSLIKKEVNSKKFEIKIDGIGLGMEEFEGEVTETHFRLRRCKVAFKDNIKFVYQGDISVIDHYSIVKVIVRFDYFLLSIFTLFGLTALADLILFFTSEGKEWSDIITAFILLYLILMIGFNYRAYAVKELFLEKLSPLID